MSSFISRTLWRFRKNSPSKTFRARLERINLTVLRGLTFSYPVRGSFKKLGESKCVFKHSFTLLIGVLNLKFISCQVSEIDPPQNGSMSFGRLAGAKPARSVFEGGFFFKRQ